MFQSRRDFIRNSSVVSLGLGAAALVDGAQPSSADKNKSSRDSAIVPVHTPDLQKLAFTVEGA